MLRVQRVGNWHSIFCVQVAVMQRVPEDEAKNLPVPIWDAYQNIVDAAEKKKVGVSN